MKRILLALTFTVVFCGSVFAGDVARVPLLNGVYSVEIPVGWYVHQEDDGTATRISPTEDSTMALIVSAPNVAVDDDFAEYAGISLGLLFREMGGGEVTGEEEGELFGYPAVFFGFSIPVNGSSLEGRAVAANIEGAAVIFTALATEDEIDAFLLHAEKIIDSYELDREAIDANAEVLARIAEIITQELLEGVRKQ